MVLDSGAAAGGPKAQLYVPRDARLIWLVFMTGLGITGMKRESGWSAKGRPYRYIANEMGPIFMDGSRVNTSSTLFFVEEYLRPLVAALCRSAVDLEYE